MNKLFNLMTMVALAMLFAFTSVTQGARNQINSQEYVYDFSVDGGSQGAIVLHTKANKAALPLGSIVKGVTARIVTALTSGGSATLSWGNVDDVDGYSGVTAAVAGFTANVNFNGWDNAAALLWDDTNDHQIYNSIIDADDAAFSFTITTADLTAGKIVFTVEYLYPSI